MSIDYNNINSVLSVFDKQALHFSDKPYLWSKINNEYRSLSWSDVHDKVKQLALALSDAGILKGDRVVIVSENRPEWQIADLAIMAIGAITVPAYITNTTADHEYIIKHSGARALIVSNHNLTKKVLPAVANSPQCQLVIKVENDNESYSHPVTVLSWDKILKDNKEKSLNLSEAAASHKSSDTACIIYTSGTGGNPKGVMLSHRAMLTNCKGAEILMKEITDSLEEIRFLSWLPLSHSYEHTLQFYFIGLGSQIYYAEGIDKLVVNMGEAKPHLMTAVPRFYDSLHAKISQGLKKQNKLSQILFEETIRLGKKEYYKENLSGFEKLKNTILNIIVRKKVKKRFGGHLQALVSGGSALNLEVGLYLSALGLPLLQGYGQTETGPVVSANPPFRIKLETVGKPLEGVNVKIAEDGEILVSGGNIMNGYWNDPEATAKTMKNRWVFTGDIGEIDNEGYLKITDRKKDIIVSAGGDNISPSRIEEKLNIETEIAQSMIYGNYKNYMVAVIVPDNNYSQQWANQNNVKFSITELSKNDNFFSSIKKVVDRVNKNLSIIEQIRKFIIIDHEFTIENNMMTPTMKVRRFIVKEKYGKKLEELY
jgi:long-chain acyl-CoA synthetase